MSDKVTLIKKDVFDIKGTTKLQIGDPWYFEQMDRGSKNEFLKKLTFNGNISRAPVGKMQIALNKVEYESEYGNGEFNSINVKVVQSSWPSELDLYMSGQYYKNQLKADYQLGCDTARFYMKTKFADDLFHTGGDGYYGDLYQMKQYHGMILNLNFDTDMFDYEEVVDRMLKLFPKAKY